MNDREYVDLQLVEENPFDRLPPPKAWVQVILNLILTVTCGFTVMSLWNWYIVPLGLRSISFVHALGIDMLITFIVTTDWTRIVDNKNAWYRFTCGMIFAVCALFMG